MTRIRAGTTAPPDLPPLPEDDKAHAVATLKSAALLVVSTAAGAAMAAYLDSPLIAGIVSGSAFVWTVHLVITRG